MYPNNQAPYPGQMPLYPGQGQMPSYPGQNQMPSYPGQGQMSSYPGQNQMPPYPGQGQVPSYPGQNQMPSYPGQNQMPSYPGQNQIPPYPGQGQTMPSYPSQNQMPSYPGQSMPNCYPPMPQPQYSPSQHGGYPPMPNNPDTIERVNYSVQQSGVNYNPHQPTSVPMSRPTLTLAPQFDASNDAATLRKAMKGFGTDEDAIISVLCRRPCVQRLEIVKAYKTAYGKDLLTDIKKETSGNFQRLLLALLTPMIQYYCQELSEAMRGEGTDEDALIEILCGGLPNRILHMITAEYKRLYGSHLEDSLKSETSFSFKRLLVSCSTGNRDESTVTDINAARGDAQLLVNAGTARWGTDESEFNRILCTRNFAQLKLIAAEYEKLTGNTLEKDIKKEFSGDVEDGMLAILRCALDRSQYFAKCLHKAVAGLGTDDRALIRLCVTRCEIDMMDIKEEYERKYKESLKAAVKGDTSGHYRHGLYALIGEY
ncbi:annexin B11-like isoform X1 [Bradysia coprophila]|uniref:annexin B11-like isoform X1 n=1 Tax=Bradysia coprophila TaxID=38358 RepID=UPI00187D8D6E|nr:annexin B11-like isoform X1 [Bradysia coprophila]